MTFSYVHAIGVFIYGAVALAGLMALAIMAGSTAGLVLAVCAAFAAYISQISWVLEANSVATASAFGSIGFGIVSGIFSLGVF